MAERSCHTASPAFILTFFFFFNDTAPPEIYTLSLHDALPICRRSATHLARPPFISLTLACPYSCNSQKAKAANQLLLSPYSTTVVLGVTPASDSSLANAFLSGMSRRTGSLSCDCQFQPTAPAMCPESYAVVSTSTSMRRTPGSARRPATQSVETSTSGCAYATLASNRFKPDSAGRVSVEKKRTGRRD